MGLWCCTRPTGGCNHFLGSHFGFYYGYFTTFGKISMPICSGIPYLIEFSAVWVYWTCRASPIPGSCCFAGSLEGLGQPCPWTRTDSCHQYHSVFQFHLSGCYSILVAIPIVSNLPWIHLRTWNASFSYSVRPLTSFPLIRPTISTTIAV